MIDKRGVSFRPTMAGLTGGCGPRPRLELGPGRRSATGPIGVGGVMTAASVALWTLLAGPRRPARVLDIDAGAVHLWIEPLAAAQARVGRDHPGAVVALLEPDAVRLPIGIVLPPAASALVPVSVAGSPVSRGEIHIGWGAITLAEARFSVLDWW